MSEPLTLAPLARWLPAAALLGLRRGGVDLTHQLRHGQLAVPADTAGMTLAEDLATGAETRGQLLSGWPLSAAAVRTLATPTGWAYPQVVKHALPSDLAERAAARRTLSRRATEALWSHPYPTLQLIRTLLSRDVPHVDRVASSYTIELVVAAGATDPTHRPAALNLLHRLERTDTGRWWGQVLAAAGADPAEVVARDEAPVTDAQLVAMRDATQDWGRVLSGQVPVAPAVLAGLPRELVAEVLSAPEVPRSVVSARAATLILAARPDLHDLPWYRVRAELGAWAPPADLVADAGPDPDLTEALAWRTADVTPVADVYGGQVPDLPCWASAQLARLLLDAVGPEPAGWELAGRLVAGGWYGSLTELAAAASTLDRR